VGDVPGSLWSNLPAILTALGGTVTALATLIGALYSARIIGRHRRDSAEAAAVQDVTPQSAASAAPADARAPLRSVPGILSSDLVKATLLRRNIYDARWNASASGTDSRYEAQLAGDSLLVVDGAHGLTWQRCGSPRPLPFADAEAYVRELNAQTFAGARDWRLPTLEEAGTLLDPALHAGFHIDPVFEKGAHFIWTTDHHPDGRIWMIYFATGQIDCERPDFNAWVRAVR
jgi:hypothetical protein